MRVLFTIILVFQAICSFGAGTIFNTNCRNALYHILNLNFPKANAYLKHESALNPANLYIPYLENYFDFLQITINEDPEIIAGYSAKLKKRIGVFEKTKDDNPDKLLILSEIYLHSAIICGKSNERFTALKYLFAAEKNLVKHPGYKNADPKVQKLLPAIILVNSYLPGLLKKFTPISNDVKNAFSILKEYRKNVANDTLLNLEGNILAAFIYSQFNPENRVMYDELHPKIEENNFNPLLSLSVALMAIRLEQQQEALSILNHYKERVSKPYPFFYFLCGELKTNIYLNGEQDLQYFLKVYRGKNYIKSAWLKLGWNYLLNNDTSSYEKCMKNTRELGAKSIEADINAQFEAEMPDIPNINLLKARLFYDGGMFAKGDEILLKTETIQSLKTTHHRLEYLYRLARINHSLREIALAKRYYKQVVQLGKDFPYYYAANSALQLGKIFEAENNLTQAKQYFTLCLSLNKFNYAASIEAKADEGLRRINR
jgi:hypothetical protein